MKYTQLSVCYVRRVKKTPYERPYVSMAEVVLRRKRKREGDKRPGRPGTTKSDENVVKIKNLVRAGRRLDIGMISEGFNIDK